MNTELEEWTRRRDFTDWEKAQTGFRSGPSEICQTEPTISASAFTEQAHECPTCDRPPNLLTWTHMRVQHIYAPLAGHGWEGWITVCEACRLRVDLFASHWIS